MNNCICVYNMIYDQVRLIIEQLSSSQVTTGGQGAPYFSHNEGFGDQGLRDPSISNPTSARFGGSQDNTFTFIVMALLFLMLVMSRGNNPTAPQNMKIGRANNGIDNRREDDYFD